jgi:hypothetical protein
MLVKGKCKFCVVKEIDMDGVSSNESAQRDSRRCSEMEVEIGRGGGTEDDKSQSPTQTGATRSSRN